jgi:hypothetical protein
VIFKLSAFLHTKLTLHPHLSYRLFAAAIRNAHVPRYAASREIFPSWPTGSRLMMPLNGGAPVIVGGVDRRSISTASISVGTSLAPVGAVLVVCRSSYRSILNVRAWRRNVIKSMCLGLLGADSAVNHQLASRPRLSDQPASITMDGHPSLTKGSRELSACFFESGFKRWAYLADPNTVKSSPGTRPMFPRRHETFYCGSASRLNPDSKKQADSSLGPFVNV